MLYDNHTGKKKKILNWAHRLVKPPLENYKQCLLGEHLLNTDACKPVAIVESEKTAIIASVYRQEFIGLTCGSPSYVTEWMFKAVKD